MEAYSPDEVAYIRNIVALAGRIDVCSVCGDHPAKDYQLVSEALLPSSAVATLRLCEDCRRIRSEMYVETTERTTVFRSVLAAIQRTSEICGLSRASASGRRRTRTS